MNDLKKTIKPLVLLSLCFGLIGMMWPASAAAGLVPMSDSELKTVALNDFVHGYLKPIIVEDKAEDPDQYRRRLEQTPFPDLTTKETYNPEAFIDDMKQQLDQMNRGQEPIAGVFPWIRNEADKQHLLKP